MTDPAARQRTTLPQGRRGDRTAADGHQLKARTIQEALNDLEAAGLAQGTDPGAGLARYWSPADTAGEADDGGDP